VGEGAAAWQVPFSRESSGGASELDGIEVSTRDQGLPPPKRGAQREKCSAAGSHKEEYSSSTARAREARA